MKNSHVWCCNVADLIEHFFQLLYIKNKSRAAADSRGCRVLRERWYFLVGKLKNLEKSGEIWTPKPFSGSRAFERLLRLLGRHFKEYLRCMCWFVQVWDQPQALPHPGEVGLVRNSHKLQTVKLRRRGEVTVPRLCRKSVLESRPVMVPGPVHNLIKLLPSSLSGEWVIFSAEAAQLMAILELWPQWLLL